jgi:hypothetical protein
MKRLGERLKDHLSRERSALRNGRLEDLPGLLQEKEDLLAELSLHGLPHAELSALAEDARKNQTLAGAARDGVSAARERIAQIVNGAGPIRSYAPDGRATAIGAAQPRTERKA